MHTKEVPSVSCIIAAAQTWNNKKQKTQALNPSPTHITLYVGGRLLLLPGGGSIGDYPAACGVVVGGCMSYMWLVMPLLSCLVR